MSATPDISKTKATMAAYALNAREQATSLRAEASVMNSDTDRLAIARLNEVASVHESYARRIDYFISCLDQDFFIAGI